VFSLEGHTDPPAFDGFDLLLDSPAQIYGEFRARGGLVVLARGRAMPRKLAAPASLLAEHERWLHERFPSLTLVPVPTLAEAAQRARGRTRVACLGTPLQAAAPLRARATVSGPRGGGRRFLVLSLARAARSGRDKSIVLFALPNRPGGLVRVLEPLARHRVNLLWLESRTSWGRPWEHLFLMEIEGHTQDRRVARALEAARIRTDYFKVLGSFPAEV
jgi:chorismate mutase/prephenate dehydratase